MGHSNNSIMAIAVRRKGVLAGMVMAILAVAIALPFTLLHPVLPFAITLLLYGVVCLGQYLKWLPNHSTGYLLGCLIALIVLLPATSLLKFAEQGFDDGPFYGQPFVGIVSDAAISDRLDYRQGELLVYNRSEDQSPVLAYRVQGETLWAQSLDVSQSPRYDGVYHLTAMSDLSMAYGIWRDRLDFLGTWNFGTERGRAYLWKWGGFHRFFLSW